MLICGCLALVCALKHGQSWALWVELESKLPFFVSLVSPRNPTSFVNKDGITQKEIWQRSALVKSKRKEIKSSRKRPSHEHELSREAMGDTICACFPILPPIRPDCTSIDKVSSLYRLAWGWICLANLPTRWLALLLVTPIDWVLIQLFWRERHRERPVDSAKCVERQPHRLV